MIGCCTFHAHYNQEGLHVFQSKFSLLFIWNQYCYNITMYILLLIKWILGNTQDNYMYLTRSTYFVITYQMKMEVDFLSINYHVPLLYQLADCLAHIFETIFQWLISFWTFNNGNREWLPLRGLDRLKGTKILLKYAEERSVVCDYTHEEIIFLGFTQNGCCGNEPHPFEALT